MGSVDRISDLPQNLTEHILQFLPLKDAVRTSILSTSWRYKWTLSPQLILDSPFFQSVINDFNDDLLLCTNDRFSDCRIHKFSNIVNNIFLNQDGLIHKFVICIPEWYEEDISHWIRFLSSKSVHQFTLLNWSSRCRNLCSLMFSCVGFANNLTQLTIINWAIPPILTTFSGFPCLITLTIHTILDFQSNTVGIIVSKCPRLENLYLHVIQLEEVELKIQSPSLQNLVVQGYVYGLLLKETERIKTLSLLSTLDLRCDQTMELCFPLIENLVLCTDYWQAFDMSVLGDCCFHHLKSAAIFITRSYGTALEFIKKILSTSPVLEVMAIEVTVNPEESMNLAKEWLRYRHTSTAEIIFNIHDDGDPGYLYLNLLNGPNMLVSSANSPNSTIKCYVFQ